MMSLLLSLLSCFLTITVHAFVPHSSNHHFIPTRLIRNVHGVPPPPPPPRLLSLKSTAPRNGNNLAADTFTTTTLQQNQTLVESSFSSSSSSTAVLKQQQEEDDQALSDKPSAITTTTPSPPFSIKGNGKTAIVLNVNARSVTSDLTEIANQVFGKNNVFLTCTKQQAQQAARDICSQHYSLVIPVGGDGTLSTLLTLLVQEYMEQYPSSIHTVHHAVQCLPKIGYIPLGTGNAVGSVVGCHANNKKKPIISLFKRLFPFGRKRRKQESLQELLQQFKNVAAASYSSDTTFEYDLVELPIMQVTTMNQDHNDNDESTPTCRRRHRPNFDLCFFAGVGFDSLMLNDFKDIKTWSNQTGILTSVLSSVTGYCVALVVKTLPKCVLHGKHNIHVKVTTPTPQDTTWIDHRRGDVMRKISTTTTSTTTTIDNNTTKDTLLYSGETGILAAGTCPYYGGNLRLFPFARMTLDKMHLRLGRIHPLTGFVNIPKIFQGSYRDFSEENFGCIDFVGSQFDVVVESTSDDKNGFPFQHSGESVGHVQQFSLSVVKEPIQFVSFWKKNWN